MRMLVSRIIEGLVQEILVDVPHAWRPIWIWSLHLVDFLDVEHDELLRIDVRVLQAEFLLRLVALSD